MKSKLVLKLLIASLFLLLPVKLLALRVPPAYNIEIVGFLTLEGKAIQHAKLELRKGNCFGETRSVTWTDEKGYYRLFEPEADEAVYVYVQANEQQPPNTYCLFEGISSFTNAATHNKVNYSINLKQSNFIPGYLANYAATPPLHREIMTCNAKGGIWGELKPKQFGCNLKFKDAGKACTDANQCLGRVCFSAPEVEIRYPDPNSPKPTGFCAVDTYQVLNKRPGSIDGEYQAGKLILYPH